jgi:hypothetical protein
VAGSASRDDAVGQHGIQADDRDGDERAHQLDARPFASTPINSRFEVNSSSGIRTNGNPKDSTTWEITSTVVGSAPAASTIHAGISGGGRGGDVTGDDLPEDPAVRHSRPVGASQQTVDPQLS